MGNSTDGGMFRKPFIENFVRSRGYPLEEYELFTEDNYILSMYRMRNGKNPTANLNQKKPAVLMVHSLLCSSLNWLDDENGLAYHLADIGFDVWMGNCRGTTFSKRHATLNCVENMKEYWNFSWHEIGLYDIPAFIDFILAETGLPKIFYIGNSQGTTTFMVLMSTRTEYNSKIILSVFLAVSAIYSHKFPLFFRIYQSILQLTLQLFGSRALPFSEFTRKICKTCTSPNFFGRNWFFYFIYGISSVMCEETARKKSHKIFQHTPDSVSLKQLIHYKQSLEDGIIRQFNYGNEENKKIYGSESPPFYDLSKITSPLAIFFAKGDCYCTPKDAERLLQKLKSVVYTHVIEKEDYGHADFFYCVNNEDLLYKYVIDIMKKYCE